MRGYNYVNRVNLVGHHAVPRLPPPPSMTVRRPPARTAAARVARSAEELTGESSLHGAATDGDRGRAESLLRNGADPAATDIDRQTPVSVSPCICGCVCPPPSASSRIWRHRLTPHGGFLVAANKCRSSTRPR